jgi:hypothetical protein
MRIVLQIFGCGIHSGAEASFVGLAFVRVQAVNGGELRKELEACAVTSNLLMNALTKQRYVHVDSQTSS